MNTTKYEITTFHWYFQPNLISRKWLKKLFYNFIFFIINHHFYAITFWMHYMLSIISLEEIKLIAIANRIFRVSDCLRLFIMSFKYGLISSRYSLPDNILFLSQFLITKTYLLLLVCKNILLTQWFS